MARGMLHRSVARLLRCSSQRALLQRLLVAFLIALTILVVVARLDAEAEARIAANTVLLQDGLPLISTNSLISANLSRPALGSFRAQGGTRESVGLRDLPVVDLGLAKLIRQQKKKWRRTRYKPGLATGEREPQCKKLIAGDAREVARAKDFMDRHKRVERTPAQYLEETRNCSKFIADRGYIMRSTKEEREFPIAYSMMMYTGVEQAERLLRAIYRPHNYHCLHVDLKAEEEILAAMRAIASCLPNVFVASRLNKVYWATFSSLEALVFCMRDLWKAGKDWRYYINLTGQEFPLKTNLQIVRVLTALNGSNVVDASTDPSMTSRWYNNFPPPHGITPYKGMVFMLASRGFVDYILHSPVASDILQWVRYTDMPDETFFPSLNHNPHLKVPGSYRGPPDTNPNTKPYIARYVSWETNWRDGEGHYIFHYPCHGKRVRNICVFGVGDLPSLTQRKEMFTNKFYWNFQPMALGCMEQWLLNMTAEEYAGKVVLNTTYYANLDIVKNKVL